MNEEDWGLMSIEGYNDDWPNVINNGFSGG